LKDKIEKLVLGMCTHVVRIITAANWAWCRFLYRQNLDYVTPDAVLQRLRVFYSIMVSRVNRVLALEGAALASVQHMARLNLDL
jgi:hypothetical protein